ncbi:MAG: orotidine-5'-phosphate decarboxylase [Pyrinomonadaceae bacterium]
MTDPLKSVAPAPTIQERIIVALDVPTPNEAREIVSELSGHAGAFKIGLQLFTSAGPGLVREFTEAGTKIFLDLKFHDIPNTVAKASVEAARLGVWMFNIHAIGGTDMMKRAVAEVDEFCSAENIARPLMIGVTVLTSSTAETMSETGVNGVPEEQVVRLARLAAEAGMNGVVTSPLEVETVKAAVPNQNFLAVTPGIRTSFATGDDQKRVTTLRQALAAGSDYVVIGRPVTQAHDRLRELNRIIEEAVSSDK